MGEEKQNANLTKENGLRVGMEMSFLNLDV